jgi:hypothetical protein
MKTKLSVWQKCHQRTVDDDINTTYMTQTYTNETNYTHTHQFVIANAFLRVDASDGFDTLLGVIECNKSR